MITDAGPGDADIVVTPEPALVTGCSGADVRILITVVSTVCLIVTNPLRVDAPLLS